MASRWERLFDQKPVPLLDALVEEVAKLLSRDLLVWPLPVESLDAVTGGGVAPFLAADSVRPGDAVFQEAFRLARWELEREVDAVDAYLRSRRYLELGVGPHERAALLFVTRWLIEQLLDLAETTRSRVRRPELVRCLERTAALLRARSGPGR